MAKPQNIILIRHGQSVVNVDKTIFAHTRDHEVPLTEKGRAQALQAGHYVLEEMAFGDGRLQVYLSPYRRTRETFAYFLRGMNLPLDVTVREDLRLREQDFGRHYTPQDANIERSRRDDYGKLLYRMFRGEGESGTDTADRVTTFLDTLHRDFEKESFPNNCLIVSHGITLRIFLMRWFRLTMEQYEKLRNPKNCDVIVLTLNDEGKYELNLEVSTYAPDLSKNVSDWKAKMKSITTLPKGLVLNYDG